MRFISVVEGDVVGELVEIATDCGNGYSLAIYVEDPTGFTALTVHLEAVGELLKSSIIVGSRVRICGVLQIMGT